MYKLYIINHGWVVQHYHGLQNVLPPKMVLYNSPFSGMNKENLIRQPNLKIPKGVLRGATTVAKCFASIGGLRNTPIKKLLVSHHYKH